jgi:hypothetical protein
MGIFASLESRGSVRMKRWSKDELKKVKAESNQIPATGVYRLNSASVFESRFRINAHMLYLAQDLAQVKN